MANVSHGQVLAAFQKRWDYTSARTVLKYALANSGVGERADYSKADIEKIVQALTAMGERGIDAVSLALLGGEVPPAAPAPAPAPAEKKEEKAPEIKEEKAPAPPEKAPEKKEEKAPEPKEEKAPEKKDDKASDKKDDKASDKKDDKAPDKKDDKDDKDDDKKGKGKK